MIRHTAQLRLPPLAMFGPRSAERLAALAASPPDVRKSAPAPDGGCAPDLRALLEALVLRMAKGVFLVDARSRVLFANRSADAMLAAADRLRLDHGRLCAAGAEDAARLHRAVAAAAQGGGARPVVIGRDGRPSLIVVASPAPTQDPPPPGGDRCAILFVKELERSAKPQLMAFAEHFRLTPAQAALAQEIAEADGVAAAAARVGISYATARTHLLHIFQKTGTRRQPELVRLILDWDEGSASN